MRTGTGVRRRSTATGSDRNATVLVANPRCRLVVGAGGDVDPRQELATLGFDSMMGIELQAALEAGLGVSLGLTLTFDHPTVDAITRHLLEDVLTFGAAPRPAADAAPMPPLGPAEAVSATDAALLEELATLTHLRPT